MQAIRTEYGKRIDEIHARIGARLDEKPIVYYSAYRSDAEDLPIDNLDEIAIPGKVQFHAEHDPYWGEGKPYTSPVIDSPTWLDVAVLADQHRAVLRIAGVRRPRRRSLCPPQIALIVLASRVQQTSFFQAV